MADRPFAISTDSELKCHLLRFHAWDDISGLSDGNGSWETDIPGTKITWRCANGCGKYQFEVISPVTGHRVARWYNNPQGYRLGKEVREQYEGKGELRAAAMLEYLGRGSGRRKQRGR
jgi:hypothetical protein